MAEALTYADAPGEDSYLHDELTWCDETPDGKQSMVAWRRGAGLRAAGEEIEHAAPEL